MAKNIFNVLEFDFNSKRIKYYDVLPYFRDVWKSKKYNHDKDKVKNKKDLLRWIDDVARYQFWARCEYEFLIASWPFGSYKMREDISNVISSDFDINDIDQCIKFENVITQDMQKIDVYEQIKMNINVITDILYSEFFKNNDRN